MAMNYKPFVGFWSYGGTTIYQRASYFVSWGLRKVLPNKGTFGIWKRWNGVNWVS